MTCEVCPNCGYDLERLERKMIGDLEINADGADLKWKGRRVALTPSQRLIVMAIARAGGAVVRYAGIAEAIGYDGDRHSDIIHVHICRVRAAFRAIDPCFNAIDAGGIGNRLGGVRWVAD